MRSVRAGAAAFALALSLIAQARAADLKVAVLGVKGRPVADAVIMVRPQGMGNPGPIRFPWPMVVEQKDMRFRPFVLVAPVGAEVAFPNHDPFQHHVYSFSPAKSFELKLYGHDETRRVRFDKAGLVSLGCNIHDDMSGFIRVVDTPYAAKTDARGEVVVHDLPAGPAQLSVWHPYLRGGRDLVRPITIPAGGGALTVTVDLRPAPMPHGAY
ncbi:MAG TPA: methylamine utilization protein [Phenylobacterium sp.]|uniref:methylamine utilization protein n=1 Tax=Phenylobacterium sp. TaxID=1871053 RepID=UPI002B46139E|nr:methylamine utilization protein [Phenylobacterium sp.]HKR89474.1 methylamine utilization protein [Phenylobacterium sp.]